MKNKTLKIHPKDNVIVALTKLSKGESIVYHDAAFEMKNDIPPKHKFFEKDMKTGDDVIMYGVLVGKTQNDVPAGELMTTTNVKHAAQPYAYRGVKYEWHAPDVTKFKNRTFNGYHRVDGRVGTANYWLFIPTVFCENRNLDVIREALQNELGYAVTDKYKQYTHHLLEAYQKGEDITSVSLTPADHQQTRPFKN